MAKGAVEGPRSASGRECSDDEVRGRLSRLAEAITLTEVDRIPAIVGPAFGVFTMREEVPPRRFVRIEDARQFVEYARARAMVHERLVLLRATITRRDPNAGTVDFGPVSFSRKADDLPLPPDRKELIAYGKGQIHCPSGSILVLNLVTHEREPRPGQAVQGSGSPARER